MHAKRGVHILFESRVRLPVWVRNQDWNVEVGRGVVAGRNVRSVKIKHGTAMFLPGGVVGVKMPGSSCFWVAFGARKVLEIRTLRGELFQRNNNLCMECGRLTGEMRSYVPGRQSGFVDAKFKCSECGHEYEHKGV